MKYIYIVTGAKGHLGSTILRLLQKAHGYSRRNIKENSLSS